MKIFISLSLALQVGSFDRLPIVKFLEVFQGKSVRFFSQLEPLSVAKVKLTAISPIGVEGQEAR